MPLIIVATTNPGKLHEYTDLFSVVPDARVISPADLEIWVEVAETGNTLAENALLKAHAIRDELHARPEAGHAWILGDDSGLEVDALGGEPGINSNRWAGPGTTAADRNRLLLERMASVPDEERTARFRCVIALISPAGVEHILDGAVEGSIAYEPQGTVGFGYDPIFTLDNGKRMSELTLDEKNIISHRGVAGLKAAAIVAGSH
ncbi:MAG: RdgB/HAM1 family non-canonical purine NTP pyrophosphatase [Chloroflexota bacterium]|nr:RdgB/HAM1 family non-canonical purine NTP pyrophosphatase [Chloroflexota bacterium]